MGKHAKLWDESTQRVNLERAHEVPEGRHRAERHVPAWWQRQERETLTALDRLTIRRDRGVSAVSLSEFQERVSVQVMLDGCLLDFSEPLPDDGPDHVRVIQALQVLIGQVAEELR